MKKGRIRFFCDSVRYELKRKRFIRIWINRVIDGKGFNLGLINVIFCSDEILLKLNRQYLKHDTLTDILTFSENQEIEIVGGEIYISVDRVRENAKIYGVSVSLEMARVIIHGVLHLLGYKDKNENEKRQMRDEEDQALLMLKALENIS